MKRKIPSLLRPILNVSESDGITCMSFACTPPDPNPAIEPGFQISLMSDILLILKFDGGLYGTEIVL